MQFKRIAECSKVSILQYFRPSIAYHLPLRPLFCLFLSGRLRQVLLYTVTPPIPEIQCFFIGGSKFGVYLCRNADVQLRLAEGKGLNNCTLVVFKVFIILLSSFLMIGYHNKGADPSSRVCRLVYAFFIHNSGRQVSRVKARMYTLW